MKLPGHELESPEPLRDVPGQRRVFRTRFADRACVTRVLLTERLPARLGRMLVPMVRDGRGSLPGIPESIALTLEGYRVAARLEPTDPPSWPHALTAGLTEEGYVYVTTTWIPGVPLHQVEGRLAEPERVSLDILRALAALHRQHVAFGDLKPANIVLTPEGAAALIDLDTLREVGAADIAVPTRDLTRTWAAPEQERGDTWLASDLWAFARVVQEIFPDGLPPGWGFPIAACRNADPLARPRTDLLLLALEGTTVQLLDWQDRPVGETPVTPSPTGGGATERVPEAAAGSATERVPERGGAASPAPTPLAPRPPGRRLTGGGCVAWVFGLTGLMVALCAGVWGWWEHTAAADADRLADEALAALKAYKTRAELNSDRSNRSRCRELADAAADVHETPHSTGVRALARVWAAGLQDADAVWSDLAHTDLEAEVAGATKGADPSAWLAWATLQGARCRLDHTSTEAAVACDRAIDALGAFDAALPAGDDWNWLRVEAAWTEVLVRGAVAHAAEAASVPERTARHEEVQVRCVSIEPLLAWAPVNGPELVQDCLHFAGTTGDLPRYFHWSRWLLTHDLVDHKLSRSTLRHIYGAAAPGCEAVSVTERHGDWVVKGGDPWCLAVGHAARGCLDLSREVIAHAAGTDPTRPWDDLVRTVVDLPADCAR